MTVADLVAQLQCLDFATRAHAASVLAEMDEQAAPAVPVLVELLTSTKDKKLAIWTLGEIGPVAEAAIPSLLQIAQDDVDEDVADLAIEALEKIDLVEVRKAA